MSSDPDRIKRAKPFSMLNLKQMSFPVLLIIPQKKEEMICLYSGIFVKSFILFCGDTVQYYITEENQNMEQLTQSSVLTRTESETQSSPWRFTALNDCIIAKQMDDYVTVENDLVSYMEKDFLTRELFKII